MDPHFCRIGFLLTVFILFGNSQNWPCGLVNYSPSQTVYISGVQDYWPAGREIWRESTFNVKNTIAASHRHAKYLQALRLSTEYYFILSVDFQNFYLAENGTGVMLRTINIECANPVVYVTYRFEIAVNFTDVVRPTFHEAEYELVIPSTWNLNKPISQNKVIIAYDDDIGIENGDLTFSIPKQKKCLESLETPSVFTARGLRLWAGELPPQGPFYYMVEILMNQILQEGCYEFSLVASSRVFKGETKIKLLVA